MQSPEVTAPIGIQSFQVDGLLVRAAQLLGLTLGIAIVRGNLTRIKVPGVCILQPRPPLILPKEPPWLILGVFDASSLKKFNKCVASFRILHSRRPGPP
jgi:hypothetical protein